MSGAARMGSGPGWVAVQDAGRAAGLPAGTERAACYFALRLFRSINVCLTLCEPSAFRVLQETFVQTALLIFLCGK